MSRKETAKRITLERADSDHSFICVDGQWFSIPMKNEAAETIKLWLSTALSDLERAGVVREWEG